MVLRDMVLRRVPRCGGSPSSPCVCSRLRQSRVAMCLSWPVGVREFGCWAR